MVGRERGLHLRDPYEYDLGRVRGFSDCVFAVAITIVVITFVLPNRGTGDDALVPFIGPRALRRRDLGRAPQAT